ncbi:hypothetical protein TEA_011170 [Camellia sinensis var. sinensis]|uniref:factor independent urate hydroxylase n=1 Tax=Camellia sinensis var. sinensis TaxID=542762 RepID=A0A4S4EWU7_CAMSN|nr:hypothetical protein TEA_011170 [Camellia sinensis var. sinensis]
MAEEMKGMRLEQRHGKARVRVGRVWETEDGRHSFAEWSVSITLLSDCLPAYIHGDNSSIVATDTMKNTVISLSVAICGVAVLDAGTCRGHEDMYGTRQMVYVKAKECSEQISMEDFAIGLGKHFTSFYEQVTAAIIKIVEKPWERMYIDGQSHEHGRLSLARPEKATCLICSNLEFSSFKLGSEKHTTEVTVKKSGALLVTSGIEGLAVLKTTKSGFEGFVRDKYTILPETRERMLATEVTASLRYLNPEALRTPYLGIPAKPLYFNDRYLNVKKVLVDTFFGPPKEGVYSPSVQSTLYQMAEAVLARFPDISSIQLKMPNIHFLPINLSTKENLIVKFEDDVYLPTDEPHGSIEASLSRILSKIANHVNCNCYNLTTILIREMDDPSHIPPTAPERRHHALTNPICARGQGRGRGHDIMLEEAPQILEEDVIDNALGDDDAAADVDQVEEALTGPFPRGPSDPSILKSFKAHIAAAIWDQKGQQIDEAGPSSIPFRTYNRRRRVHDR